MWKKKIIIQALICISIVMVYKTAGIVDEGAAGEIRTSVVAAMSKHYTAADLWDKSRSTAAAAVKAPAAVTEYIIGLDNTQQYGQPIDKQDTEKIAPVYAVSGGLVIKTDENERYGKYIMIEHDSAVSLYGNCRKIYVKEGEHVRKGHVIASFNKDNENEFYYDLIER